MPRRPTYPAAPDCRVDAYMNYDLYSDSSRTLMIGTPGSNHPLHSATFGVAPRTTYYHDFPIHGRVRAGQNLPATSAYKGLPTNSMVRYSYGYAYTPTESECRAGTPGHFGGAGIANYTWSGIHARVANTCRTSTATDMDFGTAGGLAAALEQTSAIRFKCPTNTAWHITLNDGAYAQAGPSLHERRRQAPRLRVVPGPRAARTPGQYPGHRGQWHRHPCRTITDGPWPCLQRPRRRTGQLPRHHHGHAHLLKVPPAQPGTRAGSYTDTVTVTLTY